MYKDKNVGISAVPLYDSAMPHPAKNRKDHYVPQGYLRGFIDPARLKNDRPLWCLSRSRNEWKAKSPAQIGHSTGMYDFANDAVDAEHADVTFKSMEDKYPPLRDKLARRDFVGWNEHLSFLLRYVDMMRVRSPQFFLEQGLEVQRSFIGRVISVDHSNNSIALDTSKPFTDDEIHDFTLTRMREEFAKNPSWMDGLHWQVRTTFDPSNPVITSEAPIVIKPGLSVVEGRVTPEVLAHDATIVYFPLCWQACLLGRKEPFQNNLEPFEQADLIQLRQMSLDLAPEYGISPQVVAGLTLRNRPEPKLYKRIEQG